MPVADFSLEGKVAIVTGASRGIGRSISIALAEHGADVALAARKPEPLEEARAAVAAAGGRAIAVPTNVRRDEDLKALVARTRDELGRVDVLVNNAGTTVHFGPIHELDAGAYDVTMNTNVRAAHFLSVYAREAMLDHGDGGSIVNVASVGGVRASDVIGIYSVSKAAMIMLTQVQAKTWGRDGIRSNAIAPGLIKTDFAKALWDDPAILEDTIRASALGRIAEPDEMAGVTVFLASAAASFVTGQTVILRLAELAILRNVRNERCQRSIERDVEEVTHRVRQELLLGHRGGEDFDVTDPLLRQESLRMHAVEQSLGRRIRPSRFAGHVVVDLANRCRAQTPHRVHQRPFRPIEHGFAHSLLLVRRPEKPAGGHPLQTSHICDTCSNSNGSLQERFDKFELFGPGSIVARRPPPSRQGYQAAAGQGARTASQRWVGRTAVMGRGLRGQRSDRCACAGRGARRGQEPVPPREGIRSLNDVAEAFERLRHHGLGHLEGRGQRVGDTLSVVGIHDEAPGGTEFLDRTGELTQNQHAPTVDRRRDELLRREVHAVAQRRRQHDVRRAVGGDEVGVREARFPIMDRGPTRGRESPVDIADHLIDVALVRAIHRHSLAGGHGDLVKNDAFVPRRVALEE